MYNDDYLLRQIKDFVSGILRKDTQQEQQVDPDSSLLALTGMSVTTLDALPAMALFRMLTANEVLAVERVLAVADFLEAIAVYEDRDQTARFEKASKLRSLAEAYKPR